MIQSAMRSEAWTPPKSSYILWIWDSDRWVRCFLSVALSLCSSVRLSFNFPIYLSIYLTHIYILFHTYTHSLSFTYSHTLFYSLTLSLSHTHTHTHILFFPFTHSISYTRTLANTIHYLPYNQHIHVPFLKYISTHTISLFLSHSSHTRILSFPRIHTRTFSLS